MVLVREMYLMVLFVVLITLIEIGAFHHFRPTQRYHRQNNNPLPHVVRVARLDRLEHAEDVQTKEYKFTHIKFSRAFQRYVVFTCEKMDSCTLDECSSSDIIGSFRFLDDAVKSFPNAQIEKLADIAVKEDQVDHQLTLGGMGTASISEMVEPCNVSTDSVRRAFQYLQSLSSSTGHRKSLPSSQSIYSVSPLRFAQHSPDTIQHNYNRVMDLLTRGRSRKYKEKPSNGLLGKDLFSITKVGLAFEESVARAVISEFPQLCLYDVQELEDRIRFFISPLLQTSTENDFYKMLKKGFGAGLTIEQATTAVGVVPQLLAIFYEDSQKPSMIYFYKSLKIPSGSINEARTELSQYMLGCDSSDVCSFAYLHSLGITWDQIRLLLDAFPTLTFPDKEPSWDLIGTKIRSALEVDMLNYLRKRLQISNAEVHSMLKVHSRLSTYGVNNIKTTLDALQICLGLSSEELRRLVLRMPSVVGMHVDNKNGPSTLDKKIAFFYNEVKLKPDELRKAIAKMPSLLQYSLPALRLKCHFLTNDVGIPMESMPRVISLAPVVLGLSLDENLKPKVALYKERCNLSSEQLGQLIVTCPALLSLSIKRKIEPCFMFLESNLFISSSKELGYVIGSAPRILQQGVETSLRFKVDLMRDAIKSQTQLQKKAWDEDTISMQAATILKSNPALLVTTNAILRSRIKKFEEDPRQDILEVFAKNKVGRKRKFSNDAPLPTHLLTHVPTLTNEEYKKMRGNHQQLETFSRVDDRLATCITFSALVSGQIFPRDNLQEVRGKRKAGGIAIWFPQISCDNIPINFENAMNTSFGMVMPSNSGGSNAEQNLALLGFPFLRPSRNRCDLYACHGALKLVLQLLKQVAKMRDMRNTDIHIKIYTDSSYAWKYLKNTEQLMKWGSLRSTKEMNFDGYGPVPLANPDLLLPLTNTLYRMTKNEITDKFGKRIFLGNIKIEFLHSGDYQQSYAKISDMNKHAYCAAKWQFSKS